MAINAGWINPAYDVFSLGLNANFARARDRVRVINPRFEPLRIVMQCEVPGRFEIGSVEVMSCGYFVLELLCELLPSIHKVGTVLLPKHCPGIQRIVDVISVPKSSH